MKLTTTNGIDIDFTGNMVITKAEQYASNPFFDIVDGKLLKVNINGYYIVSKDKIEEFIKEYNKTK